MKEVRIGLVGAGAIAHELHLPAYEKAKEQGVTLAAICDIDIERAKSAAEKYGVPNYYASVEEMLANCELDGVDVCTWNAAHVPVCITAAKAGKHVMCEKPAGMTVEEMRELKKILDEKNLVYVLAVPGRFANESLTLKEHIDAGEFGDIYYGKVSYLRRRGEPKGWFTDLEMSGGGPVLDIGVHAIDGGWFLMGQPAPVRVSAMTYTDKVKTEHVREKAWTGAPSPTGAHTTEDSGAGVVYFENGAQLFFEASWTLNCPNFRETVLMGTKGGVVRGNPALTYSEKNGELTDGEIAIEKNSTGLGEVLHFAECIRLGNRNSRYPIDKAIQMQSILNAIYASSKLGREVTIDKEGNVK